MAHTLLVLLPLFFVVCPPFFVAAQSAPPPAPAGPVNITAILEKGGQFSYFIRLLNETQASIQINQQSDSSTEGMTVFAPTDNAFITLPTGTLNNLSQHQHVLLVLYHVLPKYYTLNELLTVSNPVRTQASDQDRKPFVLNFTGQGNQLNVSTGIVETPINNAISQPRPLAVYQVDKVLLPVDFYQTTKAAAPPPGGTPAKLPATNGPASGSNATRAGDEAEPPGNGSGRELGFGLLGCLSLLGMGLFF